MSTRSRSFKYRNRCVRGFSHSSVLTVTICQSDIHNASASGEEEHEKMDIETNRCDGVASMHE